VEYSFTLTVSEILAVLDALNAKAIQFETLAQRSPDPPEQAMFQKQADRYRELLAKLRASPSIPWQQRHEAHSSITG
jgi:hypothetical protein